MIYIKDWQTFSTKGQVVNNLGIVGPRICILTTQLCLVVWTLPETICREMVGLDLACRPWLLTRVLHDRRIIWISNYLVATLRPVAPWSPVAVWKPKNCNQSSGYLQQRPNIWMFGHLKFKKHLLCYYYDYY